MRRQDEMLMALDWLKARRCVSLVILSGLLTIAACDRGDPVVFAVSTTALPDKARVVLQLCGRTVQMRREKNVFTATVEVTCEGEAALQITGSDNSDITCGAGYVSSGLDEVVYQVAVSGGKCSVSLVRSGQQRSATN